MGREDPARGLVRTVSHETGKILYSVRGFRLTVVEGPGQGATWDSTAASCAVGSDPANDMVLEDPTVSRFHCELRIDAEGARVRDLGSLNGTILDGVVVKEAYLRGGSTLRLGRSVLRFEFADGQNPVSVSEATSFELLSGTSVTMRATFSLLELAAASDVTVLLEGETGTGKSIAAESLHLRSRRRAEPFLALDCSAIPANLLESELFGHERGAFTSAESRRIGAFEEASGGTIFLDEVGELPIELQPKLLRVLERREIRRIGSNTMIPVDVRVVAATNRDLRTEVNDGRFRPDLFFRLAVVKIHIPALRERPDDLPDLVERFLTERKASSAQAAQLRDPAFLANLRGAAWPGNVRELRNYLDKCLVFQTTPSLAADLEGLGGGTTGERPIAPEVDLEVPLSEARRHATDDFEGRYLKALLRKHEGKVALAAAAAKVDRVQLYRLLRKHGLK